MELHYSITSANTQARLAEQLPQEMLRQDQQQARIMASVARWQTRLIGPLMFTLCLIGGGLAIYFPEQRFTPEKVIAMLVFVLIFSMLWWRFSKRWLTHLHARIAAHHAKPRKPLQGVNQRLIEARLRAPLKAAEGTYHLSFDDQGFSLGKARGKQSGLAWEQVVHLRETPDFYVVACAELQRKNMGYCIAKHSELMDAEEYQQGLQAFLSQCPVAPSAT
ncbi:YcxB family protein [Pseudomonas sp. LPH60]|uniref:YcxB family protein n=1 Tax=Pseudomonas sp. LPH60 TaxID=3065906 RepID=UPI00273AAC82|nr:YcxB family protein [Pseudomonas sp. LPH60]MDP4570842.1 YcxB family protein [Pseudomonas sp. LPH60]